MAIFGEINCPCRIKYIDMSMLLSNINLDSDEVNADFFCFIWSLLFGLFLCGLFPLGIENHLVWTGMSFGLCPKQIQNTLRALPKVGVSYRRLDQSTYITSSALDTAVSNIIFYIIEKIFAMYA